MNTHRFPVSAAAVLVVAGVASVARSDAPQVPEKRTFSFTYEVTVPKPEGAKRLEVWVPLPLEDDIQRVSDLKVEAMVGADAVSVDRTQDAPYGNRLAHVGLDAPRGDLVVRWTATIARARDDGQGAGPVLDRFKQADNLVPITGRAAELAKEIGVAEPKGSVAERAKRIYDEVLSTMTYDKTTPGFGKGDFERACDVGKGNCTDFHAKFTGIARAASIPVRFTMGIPLSTDAKGAAGGYHCWAHYHDGAHWIPVDISEAQKIQAKDSAKAQWFYGHLDPDRVALTVGRDLTLVPAQKGSPLLFLAYPYVEVDGKAVELPKESRKLTWENR